MFHQSITGFLPLRFPLYPLMPAARFLLPDLHPVARSNHSLSLDVPQFRIYSLPLSSTRLNRSTTPFLRRTKSPPTSSLASQRQTTPATWSLTLSTTVGSSVPPVHADRYDISLGPTALYDQPKLFLRQAKSLYLWPLPPHQAKPLPVSSPASGPAFYRPPWPRAPSSTMWPLVLPTTTTPSASPVHINQYDAPQSS